jgi:outer membrane protein
MIFNVLKRGLGRVAGLLLMLVALGAVQAAQAQAPLKVGYTDHEVIIVNMAEYQQVQQQLQKEAQTGQQELQKQYQDYQEKLDRYQKQQALLSAQTRQEREQELVQLQQTIQQAAQQKDQQLGRREGELMQPILEKVQKAIDKVAAAKGLDIVLRSQVGVQPVILYVNEQTIANITMDVARELGIDVEAQPAGTPAASNGN